MKIVISNITVRSYESKSTKDRIYIFIKNETTIDNFFNRYKRPYQNYKKEVIPQMMEYLQKNLPQHFNKIKDTKWGWSQKAGCSCGCSPGFVGNTNNCLEIYIDIDIH